MKPHQCIDQVKILNWLRYFFSWMLKKNYKIFCPNIFLRFEQGTFIHTKSVFGKIILYFFSRFVKSVFCITSQFLFWQYMDVVEKYLLFLGITLTFALIRVSCGLVFAWSPFNWNLVPPTQKWPRKGSIKQITKKNCFSFSKFLIFAGENRRQMALETTYKKSDTTLQQSVLCKL